MLTTEEELEALRDQVAELEDITDAIGAPVGVAISDWAERCADAYDALLEETGLIDRESVDEIDAATRKRYFELLSIEDLLVLVKGGSLPVDHPFIMWVRGDAACASPPSLS